MKQQFVGKSVKAFPGHSEEEIALNKIFTENNQSSRFYINVLLNPTASALSPSERVAARNIGKLLILKFSEIAHAVGLDKVKSEGGSNTLMTFACPCGCSNAKGNGPNRYSLYVSASGKLQANSFSKACNCLGFGGLISVDGASLAWLLKNPYKTPTFGNIAEVLQQMLAGVTFDPKQINRDYNVYLDNVERNSETAIKNVQRFLDGAQWGDKIDKTGQKLLADRGINFDLLSEETKSQIGYVGYKAPVKTLYIADGKDGPEERESKFTRRGIVFKLSSTSVNEETGEVITDYGFSLRNAIWDKDLHAERFITKKEEEDTKDEEQRYKQLRRFYIAGRAKLFNSQVLDREDNAPIFVSEGAIDAISIEMALCKKGCPAGKAVSLQGAGTQKYFLDAVQNFKGVVFLTLDEDEAGKKNQNSLENLLKEKGIQTLRFPNFLGKKDANELWQNNPEEMRKFVRTVQFIGQCVTDGKLTAEKAQERLNNMKNTTIEQWTNMNAYKIKDSIEKDFISVETKKLPEKPVEAENNFEPSDYIEPPYQEAQYFQIRDEEPQKTSKTLPNSRELASKVWDNLKS